MGTITTFKQLTDHLVKTSHQPTVAVACPYDEGTCQAVALALEAGIIRALLVGDRDKIEATGLTRRFADLVDVLEVIEPGYPASAAAAVGAVRQGRASILMKGLIGTDDLLRAVLNKQTGLLPPGEVLTHLTVSEIPGMNRLLFFSDVAVIPYPTIEQRRRMLELDLEVVRRFGVENPKVALIHFTEKVNPKFPNSVDYQTLVAESQQGMFGDAILGGPMDVKTAVDLHSAQVKGIESEVCGNADLLMFPNIESGNTFYKTISYFAKAPMAGTLLGTTAPVVLPSRSDSAQSKFYSLALAALASHKA